MLVYDFNRMKKKEYFIIPISSKETTFDKNKTN